LPTPTYTALANITLGSSASTVNFSSIPATFRDLVIVIDGTTSSTAVGIALRYNGDSGFNYAGVLMSGSGSAAASGGNASNFAADIAYADNTSKFNAIAQIMDYSATDKHKMVLSRSNQANSFLLAYAYRWANTSAITSVQVLTLTSSFAAGTTVSLYGIAS
jgi:hypothetical protein